MLPYLAFGIMIVKWETEKITTKLKKNMIFAKEEESSLFFNLVGNVVQMVIVFLTLTCTTHVKGTIYYNSTMLIELSQK